MGLGRAMLNPGRFQYFNGKAVPGLTALSTSASGAYGALVAMQNGYGPASLGPFVCDIPAGSTLKIRATASSANTITFSLVLCGLIA
jgi:hypothetical protein